MLSREFRLNVIKALREESKCRKCLTKLFDAPDKKVKSEFPAFGTGNVTFASSFGKY